MTLYINLSESIKEENPPMREIIIALMVGARSGVSPLKNGYLSTLIMQIFNGG